MNIKKDYEIKLAKGDITKCEIDAIVNAANPTLLGGGGVDGAIHRAAGSELLEECRALGGCAIGQAKITKGHQLKAKHVIHTVGPVYSQHQPAQAEDLLAACYCRSLEMARAHGLTSIAFPCISAGAYGFPKALAARVAVDAVKMFLRQNISEKPLKVTFVVHDDENYEIYRRLLNRNG